MDNSTRKDNYGSTRKDNYGSNYGITPLDRSRSGDCFQPP